MNMEKRCAYLGCQEKGEFWDDVEISPGVIRKKQVCRVHLGKLTGNIMVTGKFSLPYMFSKESGQGED